MSAPVPTPSSRPRIVEAVFWLWLVAAVALVVLGLLMALARGNVPTFFRGAGIMFALAGLAFGFLAGRTRAGDTRLRRAAVGLALALVVLLALFTVMTGGVLWLIPMILTMVGAVLIMRPTAREWFHPEETP
jgi:peptidoglycan/LPS O-acetylase OafA/YrhL